MSDLQNLHLQYISCGQGAPSLYLIVMAGEKKIKADAVIVADTGWERDLLVSDGRRMDAKSFFEEVTKPLAESYGIDGVFVRSLDKNGKPYPDLDKAQMRINPKNGRWMTDVPFFGSQGGRLWQTCTSKWKIQAAHQEMRRRGAKTAVAHLGIHVGESHRLKPSPDRWVSSSYPLCNLAQDSSDTFMDMGLGRRYARQDVVSELERLGVPYCVTTQCDGCPHKDLKRWKDTSESKVAELAEWEARVLNGEYFLTEQRIPLLRAIGQMENSDQTRFDFCESGYCFV